MSKNDAENGGIAQNHGPLARLYSSLRRLRRIRPYPYYALLERIIRQLKPRTYVEIGVRFGDSIVLADKADVCVGIDPTPAIKVILPSAARIYQVTSDAFFTGHNLTAELGDKTLDLAFIDGMHLFEFALRDFISLERHCGGHSTILIHDCYPIDRESSGRKQTTLLWSGDVWKVVVCLKKYRPALKIRTVDIAPTGLTIIRGLDPASTVLASRLQQLEQEFVSYDFGEIETDKAQKLNLVANNWGEIKTFLESN